MSEVGFAYNKDDLETFTKLLSHSIGFNARNIKRLVNSLVLLDIVQNTTQHTTQNRDLRQKILFAVGCLESAFTPLHNYLVGRLHDDKEDLAELLQEELQSVEKVRELPALRQFFSEVADKEKMAHRMCNFMEVFVESLQIGDEKALKQEEIDNLRQMMALTSLTSSTGRQTEAAPDTWQDSITLFCRSVKDEIRRLLGPNAPNAFSKKAIPGRNNSRDYRLWFKPEGAKRAWSQWAISYGLDFDRNKDDELSLNLIVWNEAEKYGLQRSQIQQLNELSIVRSGEFGYKELVDDGSVSIEKVFGTVQFHMDRDGRYAEVERAASHLAELIEATRDLLDVPAEGLFETPKPRD